MKKLSTALLLFIAVLCYVEGSYMTGNKLYSDLRYVPGNDSTFEGISNWARGMGYIEGLCDGYNGIMFFAGPNVTGGQLKDIVLKYLGDHPETRDQNAAVLVLAAYIEAFPIQKIPS